MVSPEVGLELTSRNNALLHCSIVSYAVDESCLQEVRSWSSVGSLRLRFDPGIEVVLEDDCVGVEVFAVVLEPGVVHFRSFGDIVRVDI